MKKAIRSRLLVSLVWVVVISLVRWRWYWPFSKEAFELVGLWMGAFLGTFLLEIDHLFLVLFAHPQEPTGQRVRQLLERRQLKQAALALYETRTERSKLPFHSALFQPAFYLLCFFVLTSTGSLLGAGLVMSMALQLLNIQLRMLLKSQDEALRSQFFSQLKFPITLHQQKAFVILMLLIFIGLNLFLV